MYNKILLNYLLYKTTLIENKGKIKKCLAKHFSDIGKDNLVSHRHQEKVKTFLDNIKNNKVPTQNGHI